MKAFRTRLMRWVVLACVLACALRLCAEDQALPLEPGRLTVGGRAGDAHQEYFLDAMVPVWKPGDSMLLVNPQGTLLSDDAQALSGGLVARHLLPAQAVILGANAYYDQSWTEADNTFGQVGGGVELLSRWVDARANYYYPVTDEKMVSEREGIAESRNGSRITTTTTLTRTYEEALEGYDAEIGAWLPYLSRVAPTALFVGYYDFSGDVGQEDMDGFKLRAESRLHPNITLDAEWFENPDVRNSRYFVGVRLHLPLDFYRGMRLDRRGGAGSRIRAFSSRMLDPVPRNFRVLTRETAVVTSAQSVRVEQVGEQVGEVQPGCIQYTDLDSDGNVVIITVCP